MNKNNTVIVIGAGPVGLAAAAHLIAQKLNPIVLEKGKHAGHAVSQWGHVKLFSPWKYVFDKQVLTLLDKTDWLAPENDGLPTGKSIVDDYLTPASKTAELASVIRYNSEVIAVSKQGHAKSSSTNRSDARYSVHVRTGNGDINIMYAHAVIDASGTWGYPNPIGLDGLPVPGEIENKSSIVYGIENALGQAQSLYAGKHTLVLGGGHSAINVALDLLTLQQQYPATKITWGLRTNKLEKLLGGGINDELPARGKLGLAAKEAVDKEQLSLLAPFEITRIDKAADKLKITAIIENSTSTFHVDRIIVAAGFRPNLDMLRELRLSIDDIVEAPKELAPLIDPNLHSCGSVPPHGFSELSHPDDNFFIVGMKAYGRAPTFLMLTGYEQVRSIAAKLAGDLESAKRVELVLPKTGVCSSKKGTTSSSETATSTCCSSSITTTPSCCS